MNRHVQDLTVTKIYHRPVVMACSYVSEFLYLLLLYRLLVPDINVQILTFTLTDGFDNSFNISPFCQS